MQSPLKRNPSEAPADSKQFDRNTGRESSDFMSVRVLPNVLKMKVSRDAYGTSGYIEDGNRTLRFVTAVVEPEQIFNFMSYRKASELSLLKAIKPYTEEKTAKIRIKTVYGSLVKPLGKVMIHWATRQENHSVLSLEVWVAPFEGERSLVLGEPSVSKSDFYLKRRSIL